MAERENLLKRLKDFKKNQPNFFLKEIDEEIRKRNESPYTEITDYADIPQSNARSEAIEAYLASPQFRRLALEILGGVVAQEQAVLFLPLEPHSVQRWVCYTDL